MVWHGFRKYYIDDRMKCKKNFSSGYLADLPKPQEVPFHKQRKLDLTLCGLCFLAAYSTNVEKTRPLFLQLI